MQELEILKYMLLDENTLKIMNFISKPGVSYIDRGWSNKINKCNPFFYDETKLQVEPNYNSELTDIKSIYLEMKDKKSLSEGEKKIIDLFENQVNDIMKKE